MRFCDKSLPLLPHPETAEAAQHDLLIPPRLTSAGLLTVQVALDIRTFYNDYQYRPSIKSP
jgi:hypothetical protein